MKTLSIRFDIDGIGDIKRGVPNLLSLSKEVGAKFSFYVNMGKSFNLKSFFLKRKEKFKKYLSKHNNNVSVSNNISLLKKHGLGGILESIFLNPNIGEKYKETLFLVKDNGHELGLHGGMDHGLWQYQLDKLNYNELKNLLKPAYNLFKKNFGKPLGFCSPGFQYNKNVLKIIDEFGFLYAGDMKGDAPFKPKLYNTSYQHFQIPVNICKNDREPIITRLINQNLSEKEIVNTVMENITSMETAVLYGHPSVEGVFAKKIIKNIIKKSQLEGYNIIPLKDILGKKERQ